MDANKQEADRCAQLALDYFEKKNYTRARFFAQKSQKMYPSDRVLKLLRRILVQIKDNQSATQPMASSNASHPPIASASASASESESSSHPVVSSLTTIAQTASSSQLSPQLQPSPQPPAQPQPQPQQQQQQQQQQHQHHQSPLDPHEAYSQHPYPSPTPRNTPSPFPSPPSSTASSAPHYPSHPHHQYHHHHSHTTNEDPSEAESATNVPFYSAWINAICDSKAMAYIMPAYRKPLVQLAGIIVLLVCFRLYFRKSPASYLSLLNHDYVYHDANGNAVFYVSWPSISWMLVSLLLSLFLNLVARSQAQAQPPHVHAHQTHPSSSSSSYHHHQNHNQQP